MLSLSRMKVALPLFSKNSFATGDHPVDFGRIFEVAEYFGADVVESFQRVFAVGDPVDGLSGERGERNAGRRVAMSFRFGTISTSASFPVELRRNVERADRVDLIAEKKSMRYGTLDENEKCR